MLHAFQKVFALNYRSLDAFWP